jgi:hypothetical protein
MTFLPFVMKCENFLSEKTDFLFFIYESRKLDNEECCHAVSNNNHHNVVVDINNNSFIKNSSMFQSDHYVRCKYRRPDEYNKGLY